MNKIRVYVLSIYNDCPAPPYPRRVPQKLEEGFDREKLRLEEELRVFWTLGWALFWTLNELLPAEWNHCACVLMMKSRPGWVCKQQWIRFDIARSCLDTAARSSCCTLVLIAASPCLIFHLVGDSARGTRSVGLTDSTAAVFELQAHFGQILLESPRRKKITL